MSTGGCSTNECIHEKRLYVVRVSTGGCRTKRRGAATMGGEPERRSSHAARMFAEPSVADAAQGPYL